MEMPEKYRIIEAVLMDVAGRESCYPDGDIADEIITKVRNLTGDASFCTSKCVSLDEMASSYEIRITTWENDGDDYKTQVIDGLTSYDVLFYKALAEKFRSRNKDRNGLGNDEYHDEFYADLIEEHLAAYPDISQATKDLWAPHPDYCEEREDLGNGWYDTLTQYVLGTPEQYDLGFARVFEKFEVYTVHDNMRVDVTKDF